ncbi:hypothetical protein HaLaN_24766 [Haematococcus lacustris]|uniref:Uncharacterized protein n=1 Tax=Haematococcus lacustris TaxID=44745 RepID=A0A6A0A4W4_HAELA|nr:hypothetical protein HaLaN_24766 [Haematococcus lacustris]
MAPKLKQSLLTSILQPIDAAAREAAVARDVTAVAAAREAASARAIAEAGPEGNRPPFAHRPNHEQPGAHNRHTLTAAATCNG